MPNITMLDIEALRQTQVKPYIAKSLDLGTFIAFHDEMQAFARTLAVTPLRSGGNA